MDEMQFCAIARGCLIESISARTGKELTPYVLVEIVDEFMPRLFDLIIDYQSPEGLK